MKPTIIFTNFRFITSAFLLIVQYLSVMEKRRSKEATTYRLARILSSRNPLLF